MMYDSDEALDRALFALPLEEPPADLRGSILAATAYRPAPAFGAAEVSLLGVLAALLIWLVISIATGRQGPLVDAMTTGASAVAAALSNVSVLAWLAAGSATAVWLTFFTTGRSATVLAQRFVRRTSAD